MFNINDRVKVAIKNRDSRLVPRFILGEGVIVKIDNPRKDKKPTSVMTYWVKCVGVEQIIPVREWSLTKLSSN